MKLPAAKLLRGIIALLVSAVCLLGCSDSSVPGSPGVPEPIKVLENPQTGERVRFYREIWHKGPRGYDETKHIAEWTAANRKEGFTKNTPPEEDRGRPAELRARNRAASPSAGSPR